MKQRIMRSGFFVVQNRGFTLFELLIVIFIVSLLTGLAVFSIGDRRVDILVSESERLRSALTLLREEAQLKQKPYGLEFNDKGYRWLFWNYPDKRWLVAEEFLDKQVELPEVLEIEVVNTSVRERLGENRERKLRNIFFLDQEENEELVLEPDLIFFPDGEVTEFSLVLRVKEAVKKGEANPRKSRILRGRGYLDIEFLEPELVQ